MPAVPSASYPNNAVYYTFPGLYSNSFINQPVISYGFAPPTYSNPPYNTIIRDTAFGGEFWTMASWHCDDGNNYCFHSPPRVVAAGDSMTGAVWLEYCLQGACRWTIQAYDVTAGYGTTLDYFEVGTATDYWGSTGGSAEVYNLTTCSQWPAVGVFYSGLHLWDANGAYSSPAWIDSTKKTGISPLCAFKVTHTATTVSLFADPPNGGGGGGGGGYVLAVTISGPSTVPQNTSCTFIGGATNGAGPYTFSWFVDGVDEQDGSSTSFSWSSSTSYSITLYGTDANSSTGSITLSVTVDPNTNSCNIQ